MLKMEHKEIHCSLQSNKSGDIVVPKYLTIEDVAVLLQVSKATVYRLADKREIQFIRFSGAIRISRHDLGVYIQSRTIRPITD